MQIAFSPAFYSRTSQMITTEILGKARIPKAAFDYPDGTALRIDTDYFGAKRSETNPSIGPFENPPKGETRWRVW